MVDLITGSLDIWTTAQAPKSNGNGNGAAYGIKKLRELILELAVRGKLVPQDPNDEPASVLLEKIAKEKARLVKEGKIKKEKPLPEIGEDELPFGLPEGWAWARVGSVFIVRSGYTLDVTLEKETGSTPYLKVGDMNLPGNELVITTSSRFVDLTETTSSWIVPSGSIVFPKRGGAIATNKKRIVGGPILVDLNTMAITPFLPILTKYAYTWLSTIDLSALNTGTSVPQINHKDVEPLSFPVPPLAEQHRIVAKVEELMKLCDRLEQQQTNNSAAHQTMVETLLSTLATAVNSAEFAEVWRRIAEHFDTLFPTEQSIDQLKQTILQLAVMGKLVPQNPNDEPASVLLEKIAKEKGRLVKEGKIKKEKPLPEIGEDEKPFELPEAWEWVRLQTTVLVLGDGLHGTPEFTAGTNYYFVNGNNLKEGRIEIKPSTKTVSFEEMRKHRKWLSNNSILVSINGTLGNVAFYHGENIVLGKSACYLNLSDLVSKHFVKIIIGGEYFASYALANATGSTIRNLSLYSMGSFPVPLPPLAEQHRIVAKVDELMALCDALKARLKNAQTTRTRLADAIVEQATSS